MGIRGPKKRVHKTNILFRQWKMIFYSSEEYVKQVADDSIAETDDEARIIYFDIGALTPELVRHELGHAYLAEMSFVALQITPDQYEEFFCELLAKYGEILVKQAGKIYKVGKRGSNAKKENR